MDQNRTDSCSGNSTLNSTGFTSEVFKGSNLVQLIFLTVPTISLSTFTMVAIILAEKINWKIKTLLFNIFTAEVYFSFNQGVRYLGFYIRLLMNDNPASLVNFLCKITIHMTIVGGLAKVLSIALYSITTYFFIKTNIKKIKWYAIIVPLIASWVFSIVFGLPSLIFATVDIPRLFVYRGFCSFDLENKDPDLNRFLIVLVIAWIMYTDIGGVILVFVVLTIHIRKRTSDKIKKALTRNLIYLTGGALFTIFNAVGIPTVTRFVIFELDQAPIAYVVASQFITNLLRSLSSLYIPVVSISLVKAVRHAVKLC